MTNANANGVPAGRNWFDQGGQDYARYRPEYPPALAAFLAGVAPGRGLAVDVGCGNGQLTHLLAAHFEHVIGLDPSADQIATAVPHAGIEYRRAAAEHLPVADASAHLVTAAQAAHWFDLPAFYRDEIGPYWPPERGLVDTGYATLDFPFAELPYPPMVIRVDWNLAAFLGYVQTWSAVRSVREAGRADLLAAFADDLARAWGAPDATRSVTWPINMRIGRVREVRGQ